MHRGDQRVVRTDEDVFAHHRLVLVGTIVVAGNGASANVGARADDCVTQVGQMACLGSLAQMSILQFNEVTYVSASVEHTARAQTSERPCIRAFAHNCAFEVTIRLDDCALAQGAVLDHAIRPDQDVVFDDD